MKVGIKGKGANIKWVDENELAVSIAFEKYKLETADKLAKINEKTNKLLKDVNRLLNLEAGL